MRQSTRVPVKWVAKGALLALFALTCFPHALGIEAPNDNESQSKLTQSKLTWNTESTGPRRFISAHGHRAAIFGYPQGDAGDGLEVWAYPVQILKSYEVTFRQQGVTTPIDGRAILRRIIYAPEAVTRIYAGPDFIVREKLFVPLDEPGAIIRYEVECARPIDIEIRFVPVLNLMWPASLGGQDATWSAAASAYLLTELTHRFAASVGSPDIVEHDETQNIGQQVGHSHGLAFTIRAGGSHKTARVIIAGSGPGQDVNVVPTRLLKDGDSLEKAAADHYSNLLGRALQIETPDLDINRALAWSEIALDQAWVCNPDLGCGLVAGYGPSRKARRPQYDWFFAGDGMVAIRALLAIGQYDRARQELEFILKYQDQKTGMIWHELSQSAGVIDWTKYPYMYVHVDLTFDFLNTVGEYFAVTGDRDFVNANWKSIQGAYEYCRSLLDPKDGLPRIPSEKEGGREQDPLSDELALSASWVAAAQSFANLAAATGHDAASREAVTSSQRARPAIAHRYWDGPQKFWISGYTRSGATLIDRGIGPTSVLEKHLFSEAQSNSVLDQLAAPDFQTDWGTRGRASSASSYDPNSYASGSVWAIGTSGIAEAFWAEHRPAIALPIWSALVPWSSLDSLGHMHEALAGDYYHEEIESVPEQTWSSATFLTAAVQGFLGLRIDGVRNRFTFAPHLPPNWNAITLRNIRTATSEITIHMIQSADQVRLDLQNTGVPVEMVFDPEIPLGASLGPAQLKNRSITVSVEQHPQDTHARVEFTLPHGTTSLTINYSGGVAIITDPPRSSIGEPSTQLKIAGVSLKDRVYSVDFEYLPGTVNGFDLRTPWTIKEVQGATLEPSLPSSYRFIVNAPTHEKESEIYRHGKIVVSFAP
jgi:glycogen debranching enzyme